MLFVVWCVAVVSTGELAEEGVRRGVAERSRIAFKGESRAPGVVDDRVDMLGEVGAIAGVEGVVVGAPDSGLGTEAAEDRNAGRGEGGRERPGAARQEVLGGIGVHGLVFMQAMGL